MGGTLMGGVFVWKRVQGGQGGQTFNPTPLNSDFSVITRTFRQYDNFYFTAINSLLASNIFNPIPSTFMISSGREKGATFSL